jgi:GH18 family chitinase
MQALNQLTEMSIIQDDEETIKQKIEFANKLGLGGLLIWSVSN